MRARSSGLCAIFQTMYNFLWNPLILQILWVIGTGACYVWSCPGLSADSPRCRLQYLQSSALRVLHHGHSCLQESPGSPHSLRILCTTLPTPGPCPPPLPSWCFWIPCQAQAGCSELGAPSHFALFTDTVLPTRATLGLNWMLLGEAFTSPVLCPRELRHWLLCS